MDKILVIAAFVIGWLAFQVLEDDYLHGSVKTHPIVKDLSLMEILFGLVIAAVAVLVAAAAGSRIIALSGLAVGAAWIPLAFLMYLGNGVALRIFKVLNVVRLVIPLIGWGFSAHASKKLNELNRETSQQQ